MGEAKSVKITAGTSIIRYKNARLKKYYGRILFFSTAKEVELRAYREGIEDCRLQKNKKKSVIQIIRVCFAVTHVGYHCRMNLRTAPAIATR